MADGTGGGVARRRALWAAAFVTVPAVLAGSALPWFGPSIAADLGERSRAALAEVGLPDIDVAVAGRDVVLIGVPPQADAAAAAAVGAVTGVRSVAVAPATGTSTRPTTAPTRSDVAGGAGEAGAGTAREVAEVVGSSPLRFEPDSAALTASTAAVVVRLAGVLRSAPDVDVELVGHTADITDSGDGRVLSEQRADTVAAGLAAQGVDGARIATRGVGDAEQLDTAAASRRVEITVGQGP